MLLKICKCYDHSQARSSSALCLLVNIYLRTKNCPSIRRMLLYMSTKSNLSFLQHLSYGHLCFRSYDALVGVTSNDWFHQQSAKSLEKGIRDDEKDMLMRSYIINNYETHLREIFLATSNEYSEWEQVG